ncbi:MAG TPA: T9SS type A sorting domain-containing protein, partial [Saprospiraceae bacterium]|nr:T9SS type A sorting domain-containing protein [Saprospiraceae bacterium]
KYNWTNGSTDNPILDLDPGKYYCTVSDVSNCQKELGPFVVSELTGSSSFNFVDKFELIPNPVIKIGIIDLVLSEQRPYTLRIVNMYGQTIRIIQSEQLNLKLSIDFSTFPKSLYFVILNFDNNSQTLRWLVSE